MSDCSNTSEFFQTLQMCGVEVPENVTAKTEITCADWEELLPKIHAAILSHIGKVGTVSNLEIEKIDHDKAIETLKSLVKFIDETCGNFVHIHVVDEPYDDCCPDNRYFY